MWFVLDNALVLPEYLVEFEYQNSVKTPTDTKQAQELQQCNEECNKLLKAINDA